MDARMTDEQRAAAGEAWAAFRATPEFAIRFVETQKAFAAGDVDSIVERLNEARRDRASAHVARIAQLREQS